MDLQDLIEHLGYADDPGLINPLEPDYPPGIAYHLRLAHETCGLKAAYALRSPDAVSAIPIVYLCEAADEAQARQIHRRVWNQNLTPFLVVSTPARFVLYRGFTYRDNEPTENNKENEIVEVIKTATASLENFQGLHARAITSGQVWERLGKEVNPAERVDWSLLDQLVKLGQILIQKHELKRHQAHALIGKYIYLHYLRDRNILSDGLLADWGLTVDQIIGRDATVAGFLAVTERLEEWLNGSVFPLDDLGNNRQFEKAVRKTAAVLKGDNPNGQMHLDFRRYDFSYIPIETLSVVYQQFLHAEGGGRSKGAYYTPTFLVDLVLDEVATRRPLQPGVRVLDPACGSGAFLVQTYRRLIEQEKGCRSALSPAELRDLLTDHVFGIDQDEDACRAAVFSLCLTLLDYVDPPDLRRFSEFKLPALYGANIVCGDFFSPGFPWPDFDWIVGNPPWNELKPHELLDEQKQAYEWMNTHRKTYPTGGWQIAEAFLWKAAEHLKPHGAAGMLAPAMSLFKSQSQKFRKAFFSRIPVWCVANFANFTYLLFADRATLPAAVLFFQAPGIEDEEEDILSYAPFVVNQPSLYKGQTDRREIWAHPVNGGELRRVDKIDAARGDALTWKLAMWGSTKDRRLLERINKRLPLFRQFAEIHGLIAHQGIELRGKGAKEKVVLVQELVGKRHLSMKSLKRQSRLYAFPAAAIEILTEDKAYVRSGRVEKPLQVCRPPHLIVPRNRRWAVYEDDFLIVPPRQIGIAGKPGQETLLKALALYLVSDFVTYHQLFYSAEMGIQKSVADLKDLTELPIPLDNLSENLLHRLAETYDELVACWIRSEETVLDDVTEELPRLERQANELVYQSLGLSEQERWLVEDLVHTRLGLIKGKLGTGGAAEPPDQHYLREYGEALRQTLDAFTERGTGLRHRVDIRYGSNWGLVVIDMAEDDESAEVNVIHTTGTLDRALVDLGAQLHLEHTHWLYFERGLTIFDAERVILLKPMQRLHWLRSQALQDADNVIADALVGMDSMPCH